MPTAVAVTAVVVAASMRAAAALLPVGEPSFEAPVLEQGVQGWPFSAVPFGGPGVPAYPNYPWIGAVLDAGLFSNPDLPSPGGPPTGHVDNMAGRQAAYIGGEFGNEFFQVVPANYEAGNSYTLRLGVAKSLFSPPMSLPNSTAGVRAELFYLDDAGARQFLAGTTVIDDAATGLRNDHFGYFEVVTPLLTARHPAVGQPVVIVVSMAGTAGGHFDVDDVSILTSMRRPILSEWMHPHMASPDQLLYRRGPDTLSLSNVMGALPQDSVASAVPEPAAVGMLAAAALELTRRRR